MSLCHNGRFWYFGIAVYNMGMHKSGMRAVGSTTRGFTLIELLVVIAIVGILSSVILASLSTARQKSRDAKRITEITQIGKALELYFDGKQSYPSTTPTGFSGDDAAVQMLAAVGFFARTPPPPQGTNPTYIYHGVTKATNGTLSECTAGAVCNSYELGITLERSDNPVLSSDSDLSVGTFYGINPDCKVGTGGSEQCYDISP